MTRTMRDDFSELKKQYDDHRSKGSEHDDLWPLFVRKLRQKGMNMSEARGIATEYLDRIAAGANGAFPTGSNEGTPSQVPTVDISARAQLFCNRIPVDLAEKALLRVQELKEQGLDDEEIEPALFRMFRFASHFPSSLNPTEIARDIIADFDSAQASMSAVTTAEPITISECLSSPEALIFGSSSSGELNAKTSFLAGLLNASDRQGEHVATAASEDRSFPGMLLAWDTLLAHMAGGTHNDRLEKLARARQESRAIMPGRRTDDSPGDSHQIQIRDSTRRLQRMFEDVKPSNSGLLFAWKKNVVAYALLGYAASKFTELNQAAAAKTQLEHDKKRAIDLERHLDEDLTYMVKLTAILESSGTTKYPEFIAIANNIKLLLAPRQTPQGSRFGDGREKEVSNLIHTLAKPRIDIEQEDDFHWRLILKVAHAAALGDPRLHDFLLAIMYTMIYGTFDPSRDHAARERGPFGLCAPSGLLGELIAFTRLSRAAAGHALHSELISHLRAAFANVNALQLKSHSSMGELVSTDELVHYIETQLQLSTCPYDTPTQGLTKNDVISFSLWLISKQSSRLHRIHHDSQTTMDPALFVSMAIEELSTQSLPRDGELTGFKLEDRFHFITSQEFFDFMMRFACNEEFQETEIEHTYFELDDFNAPLILTFEHQQHTLSYAEDGKTVRPIEEILGAAPDISTVFICGSVVEMTYQSSLNFAEDAETRRNFSIYPGIGFIKYSMKGGNENEVFVPANLCVTDHGMEALFTQNTIAGRLHAMVSGGDKWVTKSESTIGMKTQTPDLMDLVKNKILGDERYPLRVDAHSRVRELGKGVIADIHKFFRLVKEYNAGNKDVFPHDPFDGENVHILIPQFPLSIGVAAVISELGHMRAEDMIDQISIGGQEWIWREDRALSFAPIKDIMTNAAIKAGLLELSQVSNTETLHEALFAAVDNVYQKLGNIYRVNLEGKEINLTLDECLERVIGNPITRMELDAMSMDFNVISGPEKALLYSMISKRTFDAVTSELDGKAIYELLLPVLFD